MRTHPPSSTPARRAAPVFACVASSLLAFCSAAAMAAEPAAGAEAPPVVGQSELERALAAPRTNPGVRTRGLRIAPRAEAEPAPAEAADGKPEGGSTAAAGAPAPEGADTGSASVALDIPFQLNSSALRPAASAQLRQLAAALQSTSLAPYRFLIAGHTDASGDAGYNRRLSARRADTVRRRLIESGVAARRLEARGFGEDELLDPAAPNSAANRRVEIRNLGAAQP